jgi:hypothetical protein
MNAHGLNEHLEEDQKKFNFICIENHMKSLSINSLDDYEKYNDDER